MSTRINEFSSNLMTNALGKMKEAKEKKAEQAFYSFLDSVTAGTDNEEIVSAENADDLNVKNLEETEQPMNEECSTDVESVDNNEVQKVESKDEPSGEYTEEENKTVEEKAEAVINVLCEKLNITKDELIEQFDQLLSAISNILMEQFGVTEEKLNQVLDSLGLTLMDMFNQKDLMDVAALLSGAENIMEVLTNEDLYQQIQNVYEEILDVKEEMPLGSQLDVQQLQVLEESVQVLETVQIEDDTIEEDVLNLNTKDADTVDVVESDVPELEIVTEKSSTGENTQSQGQQLNGNEGFQQFMGRVAQAANQVDVIAENVYARQADMEAIIKQITDNVKLHVQADTTSLEMQLNPESYGKLSLQVVVRDGLVTARMAVENEMVRSALEAQVVQLKEEMSAKGLQVQAVEVTIASHEFERNLQQENQESEAQEKAGNNTRRQINLQNENLSIEEIAAMSEADALTRKIMLENGNSINFTA